MPAQSDARAGSRAQLLCDSAKVIVYSQDKNRRRLIIQRDDGFFNIFEESFDHDSEENVSYWSLPMHPLQGVYESVELAEREARVW